MHRVPQVLRCCSEFVEQHGVVDGIYRLSGVSSNIQKLRAEFESDGNPDLNKDVYLQDIHCVSSLCKAYFRELPNPLLTYQLYDKFAEAVAIQLEEERLVKIRDVLKELPRPHYRTLEFLMRHLVRMASRSSETNMHSRNLAIVWAPNLLRSKDIEATGFNGTAAFMEVRVQSIVVEFILTHVPQLFPEQGVSAERRNSLPSPSVLSNQGEGFFKCVPTQAHASIGNISPGDGPLPIRPYHAIIEGTDKRKGSLKGKKWMSIFNIGGRFPDPRKKHKHSAKEKDRTHLRPARSMDSLSSPSFPHEGSRHPGQRLPSTSTSPLVTNSPKSGSDAAVSAAAMGASEYAVTYRRGTGLVSGGAGTQGTYTALDPEGLGLAGNESIQSRSPGPSNNAARRAVMHITGPTMVTVPLHITSNLALGVLQGGGGDRVIHRGRDKDEGERGGSKIGGEKVDAKESGAMEWKVEEDIKVEERRKPPRKKDRGGVVDVEGKTLLVGRGGGEEREEDVKWEEQKVTEGCGEKPGSVSSDQQDENPSSGTNDDPDDNSEYMDMKGLEAAHQTDKGCTFDVSDKLNSTEAEGDDHELSGYVQDNFEFLDQMDCSALDHVDCSISYQVNEFSVEPPGHSDDEYELMVQSQHPEELQAYPAPGPEAHAQSPNELNPHRPLSLDLHNRHTKSLSLPYMTSPVHGPEGLCSEDEDPMDSDDEDYSSEEDEGMFYKSLPSDFFLSSSGFELNTDMQESCTLDRLPAEQVESSAEQEAETLHTEAPAARDQQHREVNAEDGQEEKQMAEKEEEDAADEEEDQTEPPTQSRTEEEELGVMDDAQSDMEDAPTSDVPAPFAEFPPPPDADVREENEGAETPHGDHSSVGTDSCATHETRSILLKDVSAQERDSDDGDDRQESEEMETVSQEIRENHENCHKEPTEEGAEVITDRNDGERMQEGDKGQGSAIYRSDSEIWDELEDVICGVIEDEESEQAERQGVEVSEEKTAEEDGTNEADVRTEVGEGLMGEKLPVRATGLVEGDAFSSKTSDPDEATQGRHGLDVEAQRQSEEEVAANEPERENSDEEKPGEQLGTRASALTEIKPHMWKPQEGRKSEEGNVGHGGVGRQLVVSKSPKVYQVKAVPVVPPKPQHCKITALTLRQQQLRVPTEQDKFCAGDAGEKERERRRDGDEGAARDANRSSPLSMCFDEAVAIATMRREKEKVCEKEKERQRERGGEVQ